MRAPMLIVFILLAGCERAADHDDHSERPAAPPQVIALSRYLPLHPGDRWRHATGELRVASGVAGIDAQGIAVVVDDARSPVTRIRASETRIEITDPAGTGLTPLLVAPLVVDAKWTFRPEPTTACEARVTRTDARVSVAGLGLTGCVEVETRCALGAQSTQGARHHVRTDTYCPDVGRVRMRSRFEPPLAEAPSDVSSELVAWRVAGGPLPPQPANLCDGLLVLPSDMAAACGTAIEPAVPFTSATGGACTFTMQAGEGFVRITAAPGSAAAAPLDPSAAPGTHREALVVGETRFTLSATESACASANLTRLGPLLRSLVAR